MANVSSMVMNPVGQWLRPSVHWVPHCWRFEPHICMATTVNFKVRYTYSFNAAPVNVQYLKKLWTCFQKGEVVNSLHNGLTQGFFFLFFFPWTKSLKTKFLKIKLQLWGIPSSTLWNQYYKLQQSSILCVFEFCKLEIPSHEISISFTLCTKFKIT